MQFAMLCEQKEVHTYNKNKDPYCKTFVKKDSVAIAAPKTTKLLKKAPPEDIEVKEENILPTLGETTIV